MLCKAVISVYEQSKNNSPSNDEIILNIRYLLLMLLKVTSQIRWYFLDKDNPTFIKFMAILNQITKEQAETEEDKTKVYWEKALTDSWERLIDRAEARNFDFFVLKEASDTGSKSGEAQVKAAVDKNYQDIDFVQPVSSYLRGLPEPIPKRNTSEAALKLLAYWEKNIIPKIIEFVRTTYKPWEMEFYFEQLRFHLRNGD